MKRFTIALAWSAVTLFPAFGQNVWKLDKSHSSIGFSATHMLISEVPGEFREFEIVLKSSEEDFSDASVVTTIDVRSLSTRNERRDGHLKSDDFFNAEKYPSISFVSTKFEKTGEASYKIHGDLTIRDVTKPAVFDAELIGVLKSGRGTTSGWKAVTSVNRFDYNLKWNRALETGGLIVGETIEITLNAEFVNSDKSDS